MVAEVLDSQWDYYNRDHEAWNWQRLATGSQLLALKLAVFCLARLFLGSISAIDTSDKTPFIDVSLELPGRDKQHDNFPSLSPFHMARDERIWRQAQGAQDYDTQ